MPLVEATVSCPLYDSFRVQQVAGMFDVPLAERPAVSFAVEVPSIEEDWQIGLIVGPSGSGKTTIARQAFGPHLVERVEWPEDRAVVDCFGSLNARQITGLLTAVGFGSPPAWVRPYQVLSRGEQFRCDLARALGKGMEEGTEKGLGVRGWGLEKADEDPSPSVARSDGSPLQTKPEAHPLTPNPQPLTPSSPPLAFDEFTSVVDRTVAQLGSAAISRAIRSGQIPCRFVAVTCHYDVAEWLEPDWVVDMATRSCQRRRLRRPPIELELCRAPRSLWQVFAPHHYLSGKLSAVARCFASWWRGRPVAFCATLPVIGHKGHWRISRIVTLPDFQGVGIGMRVAEAVCELHRSEGCRMNVTASHPALIAHCRRSPRWRTVAVKKRGSASARRFLHNYRSSVGRSVVSFEYLGNKT